MLIFEIENYTGQLFVSFWQSVWKDGSACKEQYKKMDTFKITGREAFLVTQVENRIAKYCLTQNF